MSADQLNDMKFLVQQEIGKRNLEKIGSGRELFQLFRERGKLSEDDTAFLSKLLKEIKRQDLSDKLDNVSVQPEADDGLSEEEKGRTCSCEHSHVCGETKAAIITVIIHLQSIELQSVDADLYRK